MNKSDQTTTVCISGDIDYFELETVEGCLEPLFHILREYGVTMTIPITAKAVEDYPERAEYVLKQGHEVAVHGDVHQPFTGSVEEQAERLEKARRIFKDVLGFIPEGFRAPQMRHNENTYQALIQTGFFYDSSQARNEVFFKLPLVNKFTYDLALFPSIKPFLSLAASAKYRQVPAAPYFLHDRLVELPMTGPPDWNFISSPKGPRYSPNQAYRMAEIWLDIVRDMKKRGGGLFIAQVHPAIVSPLYNQAIELFLRHLVDDNTVEIRQLGDIAKSFVAEPYRRNTPTVPNRDRFALRR